MTSFAGFGLRHPVTTVLLEQTTATAAAAGVNLRCRKHDDAWCGIITLVSSFVEEGEEHTNSEIAALQKSPGNKSLESTTWYTALTEENE